MNYLTNKMSVETHDKILLIILSVISVLMIVNFSGGYLKESINPIQKVTKLTGEIK